MYPKCEKCKCYNNGGCCAVWKYQAPKDCPDIEFLTDDNCPPKSC